MKNNSKCLLPAPMITLLALGLILAGCTTTPLNHIGAFSQASAELAKTAANSYGVLNNSTIERRLSDIAAEAGSSPTASTFENVITDSQLAMRMKLFQGVESYAKALGDLASADFRKDIDSASKDLFGSLGELQNTYAHATKNTLPLTESDLAIIATAIDAIGTAIAEDRRRAALKTVIIQADPSIQKAMNLISEELPEIREMSVANMSSIFADKVKAYQNESNKMTPDQRIEKLTNIRQAYEVAEATSHLFENVVASSKKIADAHSTLRSAVEANKFTSPALVGEIKELVVFARVTKEFHDKLLSKTP